MKSKLVKIGLVFFLISIFQIPVLEKSYSADEAIVEDVAPSCTSGWEITGYFLPIESDYSGNLLEISVGEIKKSYVATFVDVIRIEGWGKTNAGDYLGWYSDSYHIADTYFDSQGGELVVGTIAVDESFIATGAKVTIPTLPEPWGSMVFDALDEGPAIIGKHIDVFTGEGIEGEQETFRITSSNNDVCTISVPEPVAVPPVTEYCTEVAIAETVLRPTVIAVATVASEPLEALALNSMVLESLSIIV